MLRKNHGLFYFALGVLFITSAFAFRGASYGQTSSSTSDDGMKAAVSLAQSMTRNGMTGEPLPALGAFSCDFTLDLSLSGNPGPIIERDRIWLQQDAQDLMPPWAPDPGMLQKHIPIIPSGETTVLGGGRYLFTSRLQAARYENLIKNEYTYPEGVQFLSRPEFSNPECRDWGVVIAWRFTELNTHTALRTERFDTGRTTLLQEADLRLALILRAPRIIAAARDRGYGEVHILHNAEDHRVQLVYFQPRLGADNPDGPALGKLLSEAPLGDLLTGLNLNRVFDLTQFVLTIWLPYGEGDSGAPALWPNSPPLPEPFCGDGVCVPSRGENSSSCAVDCPEGCGDGVCIGPAESKVNCPVDCHWDM